MGWRIIKNGLLLALGILLSGVLQSVHLQHDHPPTRIETTEHTAKAPPTCSPASSRCFGITEAAASGHTTDQPHSIPTEPHDEADDCAVCLMLAAVRSALLQGQPDRIVLEFWHARIRRLAALTPEQGCASSVQARAPPFLAV